MQLFETNKVRKEHYLIRQYYKVILQFCLQYGILLYMFMSWLKFALDKKLQALEFNADIHHMNGYNKIPYRKQDCRVIFLLYIFQIID